LIQERWHFARTFGRAPFHHLIRDSSSSFILPAQILWTFCRTNRRFEFHKRRQLFIRAHNETVSVVAMCICNPDPSPFAIQS